MYVPLFLRRLAATEAAIYAGVITVEHADDVHEYHVAGLDQAVRTQVRMRVGTVARRHLHVVHPLRAQPVHLMGCNRLQIILLDAGSNSRRDLVECGIDDGSTVFQAHDLVFVLDRIFFLSSL
jgi:hypothetical protein